ncbi:MAG: GUN4 domain-containing protein [Actinomycetota bacterium]
MSHCVNPHCKSPINRDTDLYCLNCHSPLLLQERYCPLKPIGQGGFGKTFLAIDRQLPLKPRCVIKQLFFPTFDAESYNTAVRLFRQEAQRLNELGQHPQIPQLLAHFEQQEQLYLVQEFIEGQTLAQELQETGPFTEAEIWELLEELLPVLQFIHQHQIVHRDIKPANIIRRSAVAAPNLPNRGETVTLPSASDTEKTISSIPPYRKRTTSPLSNSEPSQTLSGPIPPLDRRRSGASLRHSSRTGGSVPQVSLAKREPCDRPVLPVEARERKMVLIDFGVAKLLTGTALSRTGTVVGSAEYMAPEQTRGKAIPASDLFSLGVTCIRLLTDVAPWDLYDIVNDRWVWRDFLPSGSVVSDRLGRILDKLLQNSLTQRYQSAAEVLQALKTPPVAIAPVVKTPAVKPATPHRHFLAKFLPQRRLPTGDRLESAVGVDYTPLQHLLAAHKWKEADQETWRVLCQALGKPTKGYLHPADLGNLPCADLQTIDRLWVKYSEGLFGFSVQKSIYESVGGDYGQFCDRVGWLTYNPHTPYEGIQFNLRAPSGHLPSRVWVGGIKWWQHAEGMTSRLALCEQSV